MSVWKICFDNIDFEVLLQAVAHSAKTVYAYESLRRAGLQLQLSQRAAVPRKKRCGSMRTLWKFVTEAVICARTMEVWLLEDLTLAIVSNYSVLSGGRVYNGIQEP